MLIGSTDTFASTEQRQFGPPISVVSDCVSKLPEVDAGVIQALTTDEPTKAQLNADMVECSGRAMSCAFSCDPFNLNPLLFFEVQRPYILELRKQYKSTVLHRFLELLHQHGLLTMVLTQNVNGPEHQADVPGDKIFDAHGASFISRVGCETCNTFMSIDALCDTLVKNVKDVYGCDPNAVSTSSAVLCPTCGAEVKPRSPSRRFMSAIRFSDMLICVGDCSDGTSIALMQATKAVKVVFNAEPVDGLEFSTRDVFVEGHCEESLVRLIDAMGWMQELRTECMSAPSKSLVDGYCQNRESQSAELLCTFSMEDMQLAEDACISLVGQVTIQG